jgi:predicted nucleotidyltransferase
MFSKSKLTADGQSDGPPRLGTCHVLCPATPDPHFTATTATAANADSTDLRGNWQERMEISEACVQAIREWAARTDCVREVWLFGSRAKRSSKPYSDVDLAIYLMPPDGSTASAGGAFLHSAGGVFLHLHTQWELELKQIVGLTFDLTLVDPDNPGDQEVRSTGKQLWVRT